MLFSCGGEQTEQEHDDRQMMTEYVEHMTRTESENGLKKHTFSAPLVESYSLAHEPYSEFREGIEIITFTQDSLAVQDTRLTANYAINYTQREMWEAKGNVIIRKSDGQELHTQQLFWNQRTGRFWSNLDTRIVQPGGGDIIVEGFESDQEFKKITFGRIKGRMPVNVEPNQEADTAAVNTP